MVVGNLICQNGVHEVLRCIESVYPIVDEYHIVDGYSTDGTWELLNKYKDVYNLTLYQNKFVDMEQQRNWLLEKTPKDCWVINIDQDEKLEAEWAREFIASIAIDPHEVPIVVGVPFYNLIKDPKHHFENPVRLNLSKIFYNDKNLRYDGKYHAVLTYDGKHQYVAIEAPTIWRILHYAWLDPERLKNIRQDIKEGKREYNDDDINFKKRGTYELPIYSNYSQ